MCKIWDKIENNSKWKIGYGKKVKFWNDCWHRPGLLLRDTVNNPLNTTDLQETVSNFIMPKGEWNKERIRCYLPESTCNDIFNSNIHFDEDIEDSIVWNFPKEVVFSVKSANYVLTKETHSNIDRLRELIWRPRNQRNKTFLWLCAKNKILTNVQRVKRNLTTDPLCPICRMDEESVLHALLPGQQGCMENAHKNYLLVEVFFLVIQSTGSDSIEREKWSSEDLLPC